MNGLTILLSPLTKINDFNVMCQAAYLDIDNLIKKLHHFIYKPNDMGDREALPPSNFQLISIKVFKEVTGIIAVAGIAHILFYQFCQKANGCISTDDESYRGVVISPVLEELVVRGFFQHFILINQLAFNHLYNSYFTTRRTLHANSFSQKTIRIAIPTFITCMSHGKYFAISSFLPQGAYGRLTDEEGSLVPSLALHCLVNLFTTVNEYKLSLPRSMLPYSLRIIRNANGLLSIGILCLGKKLFSIRELKNLII
jgi:hypothetical protein